MQSIQKGMLSLWRNGFRSAATVSSTSSKPTSQLLPPGFRKTPPFGLFVKENFARQENLKVTERIRQLRDQWRSLSPEAKKKYLDKSNAQKQEKEASFASLSDDERQVALEKVLKQKEARVKRKKRQTKIESGVPSRPLSSYNLFVKEKMSKMPEGVRSPKTVQLAFKEAAAEWRGMSYAAKQVYKDKAQATQSATQPEIVHTEAPGAKP